MVRVLSKGANLDELLRVSRDIEEAEARARTPETALRPHDHVILDHIRQHGFVTDRDYARLTERAKATRALDLRRLVELGLIERQGKGRGTYYKAR